MGIPLSCIRDIRILYGLPPGGTSEIDFDFANHESSLIQRKPAPKGHVIACRITAENPDAGFKPNSGKVLELNFRSNSNVWGYFSVGATGGIHEYADSQFGHIFSYGFTRSDARKNMIVALKELSIRGDFRTTTEYLIKLLETEAVSSNTFTTGWLDSLISKKVETEKPDAIIVAICGAVFKASTHFRSAESEYLHCLEKGQIPNRSLLSTTCSIEFIYDALQYKLHVSRSGPDMFIVQSETSFVEVQGRTLADDGLLILIGTRTHVVYGKEESHLTQMTIDGKTCSLEKENDPTKLRSPSPGKLVRFLVENDQHINMGDAFAEIEVIKLLFSPVNITKSILFCPFFFNFLFAFTINRVVVIVVVIFYLFICSV